MATAKRRRKAADGADSGEGTEQDENAPKHQAESHTTIPGGIYGNADGTFHDAHGNAIDQDGNPIDDSDEDEETQS